MARPSRNDFVALIGDVVASRAPVTVGRAALQRHLQSWIDALNARLGPGALAAPLTLTSGDEIQGLFRRPEAVVDVVQDLTDHLFGSTAFPYAVFGVGRGALATGPIPAPPGQAPNPALLDGPAFHRARACVEQARSSRAWVRFEGFEEPLDEVLDGLFALMAAVRSRWTAKQGRYSFEARASIPQKELARKLRISPSVVSESLKAASHEAILAGEQAARLLLRGGR
jgi:hypothetical protein